MSITWYLEIDQCVPQRGIVDCCVRDVWLRHDCRLLRHSLVDLLEVRSHNCRLQRDCPSCVAVEVSTCRKHLSCILRWCPLPCAIRFPLCHNSALMTGKRAWGPVIFEDRSFSAICAVVGCNVRFVELSDRLGCRASLVELSVGL